MKRLVYRKDARDMTKSEAILTDYPLTAEEEAEIVPFVGYLLEEGKEIPESSEELLEANAEWKAGR